MSIALVVTGGFGNGTLTGSIEDVVTRGFSIGEDVVVEITGPTMGVVSKISLTVGKDGNVSLTVGMTGGVN